jgi:hypothetical protein
MQSGENVNTFFKITDNSGNILMHMGSQQAATYSLRNRATAVLDNNYMQSSDFNTTNKTGLNIDFSDGKMTGYNFALRGENSQGSYFNLSSDATKFFEIHYKDTSKDPDVDVSVMKIDTSDYYLHSFDWISGAQGTEIDLENGRWLSYCNTGTYDGKGILINAADSSYPLVIGGSGAYDNMYKNATFKVAWDGSLSLGADKAFTVSSEGKVVVGNNVFVINKDGSVNVKDNFKIDVNGILTATGASLTSLTVTDDTLFNGNISTSEGKNLIINGKTNLNGETKVAGNLIIDGLLSLTTGQKIGV